MKRTPIHRTFPAVALLLTASALSAQDLGSYTELGPMPFPNAEFGAAELDGLIYLAGGFSDEEALMIYDPATDSWNRGADLPQGVHHPAVAAFGGLIYVIGGHEAESMVQIYDPETDSWGQGAEVPSPRRAMAIVVLRDRIHVIGGTDGEMGGGGKVEHGAYDPATDSWEVLAPLLEPRDHGYAGVLDGKIYYASGRLDFIVQPELQIYDPETNSWSFGPDLLEATSGHAVQVVANRLYAIGGEDVPFTDARSANQRYDPFADQWELMADLPQPLHAAASAVYKGSIYLFGGTHVVEPSSRGITQVLRYDPPDLGNPAPRKLRARVRSRAGNKVRLRWRFDFRDSTADRLEIQARLGNGPWEEIATVEPQVRKRVVKRLERNAVYSFRLRANGPDGPSDWSNVRTVDLAD